jgi:hypothetical protein
MILKIIFIKIVPFILPSPVGEKAEERDYEEVIAVQAGDAVDPDIRYTTPEMMLITIDPGSHWFAGVAGAPVVILRAPVARPLRRLKSASANCTSRRLVSQFTFVR